MAFSGSVNAAANPPRRRRRRTRRPAGPYRGGSPGVGRGSRSTPTVTSSPNAILGGRQQRQVQRQVERAVPIRTERGVVEVSPKAARRIRRERRQERHAAKLELRRRHQLVQWLINRERQQYQKIIRQKGLASGSPFALAPSVLSPRAPTPQTAKAADLRAELRGYKQRVKAADLPTLKKAKAAEKAEIQVAKTRRKLRKLDPQKHTVAARQERKRVQDIFDRGGKKEIQRFIRASKTPIGRRSPEDLQKALMAAYGRGGKRAVAKDLARRGSQPTLTARQPGTRTYENISQGEAYLEQLGLGHLDKPTGEKIAGIVAEVGSLVIPGGGVARIARGEQTLQEVLRASRLLRGLGRGARVGGAVGRTAGRGVTPQRLRQAIGASRGVAGVRRAQQAAAQAARRAGAVGRETQAARAAAQARGTRGLVQRQRPGVRVETRGAPLTTREQARRGAEIQRELHVAQRAAEAEVRSRGHVSMTTLRRFGDAESALKASNVPDATDVQRFMALNQALNGLEKRYGKQTLTLPALHALGGTEVGTDIAALPFHVAKAFVEDRDVRVETFRALKALPREFLAGIARAAVLMVTDPTRLPKEMWAQYKRTYGPLLEGNVDEFRARLAEPGSGGIIGPLLDIVFVAAPGASYAGGFAARAGLLGKGAEALMKGPRRDLRYSVGPGAVMRQHTSPRLFKRYMQERRDVKRERFAEQERAAMDELRDEMGQEPEAGTIYKMAQDEGTVPSRGAATIGFRGRQRVVPFTRYPATLGRRAHAASKRKVEGIIRRGERENELILKKRREGERPGAKTLLAELTPEQQLAVFDVFQIGASSRDPKRFAQALRERRQQIIEHNLEASGGKRERPNIPRWRVAAHDEIQVIDRLLAAVERGELHDEKFISNVEVLREIQDEIEQDNIRLNTIAGDPYKLSQADMRVAKPYVEFMLKWDRRRAAEGKKRILPEFEGDLDGPEFGAYINSLVESSLKRQPVKSGTKVPRTGMDVLAAKGDRFGLGRPGYVMSERRDIERFGSRTVGGAHGAALMQPYTGALFRSGRQSRNPRVILEGMRTGIKQSEQARMILELAAEHGLSVAREWKAQVIEWMRRHGNVADKRVVRSDIEKDLLSEGYEPAAAATIATRRAERMVQEGGGIPDVIRTRASGAPINLRQELEGKSIDEQFAVLVDRQVIDPYHIARAWAERVAKDRFPDPDRRREFYQELEALQPTNMPVSAGAEPVRLAEMRKFLEEERMMPPLLKGIFEARERQQRALAFIAPQREPQPVKKIKGDLGGELLKSFVDADDLRRFFDDNTVGQYFTEHRLSGLRTLFGEENTEEWVNYLTELRGEVWRRTQKSLKERGYGNKMLVWRVGPLERQPEGTPVSMSIDPRGLDSFEHRGRGRAQLYEVDTADVLADVNAFVHKERKDLMARAMADKGFSANEQRILSQELGEPSGSSFGWEPRFAFENEVLVHPRHLRPVTDKHLRLQAAKVQHAGDWADTMTAKELVDAMDELGFPTSEFVFYNPKIMYQRPGVYGYGGDQPTVGVDVAQSQSVRDAWAEATVDGNAFKGRIRNEEDFANAKGFIPIPRDVANEIEPIMNKAAARFFDISKNKASRILLGLVNPSWMAFQVGANAFLAGVAGTGPLEVWRANRWWKTLDSETQRALEPIINIEPHLWDKTNRYLGFEGVNNTFARRWHGFQMTDTYERFRKANILSTIIDTSFRFDRWQTAGFRRAVFFNQMKKEALRNMGASFEQAWKLQGQLTARLFNPRHHALDLDEAPDSRALEAIKPGAAIEKLYRKGEPSPGNIDIRTFRAQMDALIRNRKAVEQHAAYVSDFLGDYSRFSALERQTLQRFVMFYGFLRHSVRLALWTLPTRHPIAVGIMGRLALLSDKEQRELLGVDDLPFGLAGLNFKTGDRLLSVNLGRMSPTGNILFSASNPLAVTGMLPPLITVPLAMSGFNMFTGKFSTVLGENRYEAMQRGIGIPGWETGATGLGIRERLLMLVAQVENLIPPLRAAKAYRLKGPQGDDATLIFGPRPQELEEAKAQIARAVSREEERGLLGALLETFGVREIDPGYLKYLREKQKETAERQRRTYQGKKSSSSRGSGIRLGGSTSSGGSITLGGGRSSGSITLGGS